MIRFFFQIPPSLLETMLVQVELGYAANGNPYHNHMHACDVLQTVHYFISQTGLSVSAIKYLTNFTAQLTAFLVEFLK